jgi:hypothetical protein
MRLLAVEPTNDPTAAQRLTLVEGTSLRASNRHEPDVMRPRQRLHGAGFCAGRSAGLRLRRATLDRTLNFQLLQPFVRCESGIQYERLALDGRKITRR